MPGLFTGNTTRVRLVAAVATAALVVSACGGDSTDPTTTTVGDVTTSAPAETTTSASAATTTSAPPSTTTSAIPPEEAERPDLLTFARGAIFVSQSGLASGGSQSAIEATDGDPTNVAVTTDDNDAVEFVFKLPANTVFDRFAIPDVLEQPGNATFYETVIVSGSAEGPDSGYVDLAVFELVTHEASGEVTEIIPDVQEPVRWVKVHLEGGILIEPGDEGRTNLRFSEIIGNGTQDAVPLVDTFDGIWSHRLTERLDLAGAALELHQDGTTLTGCLDRIVITGTVTGNIARATGIDTLDDRPSAYIFVADVDDGTIHSVVSVNQGAFKPYSEVDDPDVTSTPCSEEPPEAPVCDAIVYINFDVNSAVIRTESDPVLSDLYDRLLAEGIETVSIEGHTSTEGSDEYNLDLSERRAQSVVDDLVSRGYDGTTSAVGKGESEPLLSPDNDESSREINRRVEIVCG